MALKKKKKKKEEEEKSRWHDGLNEQTKYSVWGVVCLGASLFLVLAIFDKAGFAGNYVHSGLKFLLGQVVFLAPTIFFFAAVSLFARYRPNLLVSSLVGGVVVFISCLALVETIFSNKTGGYIGFLTTMPFLKLIDYWATLILFSSAFVVGLLIMFDFSLSFSFLKKPAQKNLFSEDDEKISESLEKNLEEIKEEQQSSGMPEGGEEEEEKEKKTGLFESFTPSVKSYQGYKFEPPPLVLLETDKGKASAGDIKANANIIKRTFQNFGIDVAMDEVRIGPSVTQYALKPAEGIKLSRITALNNDLALALASHPIRIEAPIPGKSLVGIEVPNRSFSLVGLRQLLGESDYKENSEPLILALGRNVAGRPVYSKLSKMPHLLIAGATGSGKSVAIHSLMMSLLYHHAPWELKLLLIDPKRVELNIYNDIPYLLSPVITEAKKAIISLKWATKEMEKRYEVLLRAGVRDIHSYHKKSKDNNMPYLVIVLDELADIMATYPREFESSIVRLAQMSRAVGIHLVVSTQRPSVEVITGLIKANITTRIAFQMASQVDSRTVLDMAGAERLLGNGDMLFLSGDSAKPRRIQGAFVSEREVKKVVDYIKNRYDDLDLGGVDLVANGETKQSSIFDENSDNFSDEQEDELYEEARGLVIETGKASSSYLQRRLRIGYARAARLLDMLEEKGVVGPADGSRARVILTPPPSNDY